MRRKRQARRPLHEVPSAGKDWTRATSAYACIPRLWRRLLAAFTALCARMSWMWAAVPTATVSATECFCYNINSVIAGTISAFPGGNSVILPEITINCSNEECKAFWGPPGFVAGHITYRFLSRFK